MKRVKYTRYLILSVLALGIFLLSAGFFNKRESHDFNLIKNMDIYFSLFRELNTFYVDDIDPKELVETSINEMLQSLDPYTVYYPEENLDDFELMTTGQYGGVGSLIRKSGDYAVISEVYEDFPADKAGARPGDLIKAIDGVSVKGLTLDQISTKMKGKPGSQVRMTFERLGKEIQLVLQRSEIDLPPVPYYGMLDPTTGYIRFTNFTLHCHKDVLKALKELKAEGAEKMVLDVRGNPGGLLLEAVEIVNFFIDKGQEVVSTRGKVKQYDVNYTTRKDPWDTEMDLVVLINRNSASAAEILAGALQDLDRAVIIGQRSFGKGLVQTTRPLSYNSKLKVTTAKYYIPSGRCIQALDFTHRNEDGSVGTIPDSLISEFSTRNGRTVTDGGGIQPDLMVEPQQLSALSTELYLRFFVFDYATRYYWENPQRQLPSDFAVTDEIFRGFKNYVIEQGFNYQTQTERALNLLVEQAKRENYFQASAASIETLQKELSHSLDRDLDHFRPELESLLKDEITLRYDYRSGQIERSLSEDPPVLKAMEVLNDGLRVTAILEGKADSDLAIRGGFQSYGDSDKKLIKEQI